METLYAAQIAPLRSLRPISGKDRIQVGVVCGEQVIVGIVHKEGELGVFFPPGSVISEDFLVVNDLLEIRDESGKKVGGGHFENGRVRAKNFGGVKSDGFWAPLSFLSVWAEKVGVELPQLKSGVEISEINGAQLCSKYIPKRVQREPGTPNKVKETPKATKCPHFKEHKDTPALGRSLSALEVGDILQVTAKMEGTSGRSAKFRWRQTKRQKNGRRGILRAILETLAAYRYRRAVKRLEAAGAVVESPVVDFCGSRRVQLNPVQRDEGFFGTTHFRWLHHSRLAPALSEGMTVYYEIVGWNGTTPIQPRHNPKDTGDKAFIKKWGSEPFVYSYGCSPGQSKISVYRITWMDDRGQVWEFSPEQIQAWCAEAGVDFVPVFADKLVVVRNDETGCWVRSPLEAEPRLLLELLDELIEANEADHPHEGCIVRVLTRFGWLVFKYKTWFYRAMAGLVKADEVDTEEEENQVEGTE